MIKLKVKGTAIDANDNEQEVDIFLDIDEQSTYQGVVRAYGAVDAWQASFVPVAPFDPYAARALPNGRPASGDGT